MTENPPKDGMAEIERLLKSSQSVNQQHLEEILRLAKRLREARLVRPVQYDLAPPFTTRPESARAFSRSSGPLVR
jgi:hypothetical protein